MKIKEYFLKLKEQGKIENEAFNKFLETVPEGEMPDEVFPILDSTFLTLERAQVDKNVTGKVRAQVLDVVDRDIKAILKFLPADKVLEIEREPNTFNKLSMVRDSIPEALSKAAKAPNDEEAKKKLQQAEENLHAMTEKFTKQNSTYAEEVEKAKQQAAADLKNYKLVSELQKKANSYTFAEAFPKEARPDITKAILDRVLAKNKLDLIEKDGEYHIPVMDETGAPRFENNGNTPVTINSILDNEFKPYLKVSNTETTPRTQEIHSAPINTGGNGQNRRGANVSVEV